MTRWNIVTWSEWCLLNEDLDRIDGLYNEIYLNQITSLRNLLSMWKIIDLNCTYKIFFCVRILDKICIQFWIIESSKFYIIRARLLLWSPIYLNWFYSIFIIKNMWAWTFTVRRYIDTKVWILGYRSRTRITIRIP